MSEANAPREIRDPRVLRGVAHPLRLALLELVGREGKLTATSAGELTGESVASCSFHLRQLAKYGLIETATGGTGRQKPWRLVSAAHSWDDVEDATVRAYAGRVLTSVLAAREFEQFENWLDRRGDEARKWQRAALTQHSLLYLAPKELAEFSRDVSELVAKYAGRLDKAHRPPDARPVRFFSIAYPVRPTKSGN